MFGEKAAQASPWAEQRLLELIAQGPTHLLEHLENEPNPGDANTQHPAVQSLIDYLKPNIDGLWYAVPIGSGMVEGACKNVIGRRMKCNSARWLPDRATHLANLCCLHYSDQWEQFWTRSVA